MSLTPVELRHELHKNPELAFNEFETTKILIEEMDGPDVRRIRDKAEVALAQGIEYISQKDSPEPILKQLGKYLHEDFIALGNRLKRKK